jgi:DNA modification methylase
VTSGSLPHRSGSLADLPPNVWFIGQESTATQRQGRYSRASVRGHPGKMRPALARRLIETYTKPGEWVLDPMAGIGTTGVEAVHHGRHFVGIEIEPRFVAWQRQNLERARRAGAPGRFAVYRADARRLDSGFPCAADERAGATEDQALPARIDTVILSPPYADRLVGPGEPPASPFVQRLLRLRHGHPGILAGGYGTGRENIGNLAETAYFAAMRHIYAGCGHVLRPGGLLVIVLQPNHRGARLLPLQHQTIALIQEPGFELLDEIIAVLGRIVAPPGEAVRLVNHTSLWRRLATARLREAGWRVTLNQLEYVLVFRKPLPARGRPPRTQPALVSLDWPKPRSARRAVAATG